MCSVFGEEREGAIMGEYYNWVNVDRREYICPNDFNYGNKLHEFVWPGNVLLCALRELLSREWAGDHILFMGDERLIPEDTDNDMLKILYRHTLEAGYPGDAFDSVVEMYRNVSGLFREAEPEVRGEIQLYLKGLEKGMTDLSNEYGIDVSKPFKGFFMREGHDFPFTVNHTKKVCYSLERTKIYSLDHEECNNVDPLPFLMCYGRTTDHGAWLGDIIGIADEIPEGYVLLDEICVAG